MRLAFPMVISIIALLFSSTVVSHAGINLDPAGPGFSHGGNAPWFSQSAVSHDGIGAYQSGAISHSQSSWMETTVTGPGAIRYYWKVSSERCCDPLSFSIDGVNQTDIRGEIDWQKRAFAVPAGNHTVRWNYSTDSSVLNGSNSGWVDEITFEAGSNIDVTAPTTTTTPAAGMYASSQSVALSCTDNVGCTGTYYCLGSGCNPTTPYSAPVTVSSANDLRFYSTDAAGNSEVVKTATYTFDTTPPTTSVYPSGGSYSGARNATLSCSDYGTGCAGTNYCLGDGCTPTTQYNTPIAISASTDLRFYSTDNANNSETVKTANFTINPDTTPPVTTPNAPSGTYGPFYTYYMCNDGDGSGCAGTYYCLGAGCVPATAYTSAIYIASSTEMRVYSRDNSGNSETVQTFSYVIDKTPPVTTATPPGGSYESAPQVTFACSDPDGTGCRTTFYCLGEACNPTIIYGNPVPINTATTLRFYSVDNASNSEAVVTERYINPAQPKTIAVPGMQPTIQIAIDASYNGDKVLVSPGTYFENINFKGKGIAVESSDGPEVTIIDGNGAGPVVTFNSDESLSAILSGFTIRNGMSSYLGGGIYIDQSSPSVLNNSIVFNSAQSGGGIGVDSGLPLIRNNIISRNSCNSLGGGIIIRGESLAQITDNIISENRSYAGGGISLWNAGFPLISGNRIRNNSSTEQGGGISIDGTSNAVFTQNLIVSNKGRYGGGIYAGEGGGSFISNTIVDNDSTQGAGVYLGNASFVNNIMLSRSGQPSVYCHTSSPLNFSNNMVYSPSGSAYSGSCPDQNGRNGNITADPRLSNAAVGSHGLSFGSPAIDAGSNSASVILSTDLDGMARVIDGNSDGRAVVDIGAYEFDPTRPVATLQGIPTDSLTVNSLNITVGGAGVATYRYSVDGGEFVSTDTAVAVPISLTGLANGLHTIVVLGKTALGLEQALSTATAASWVVNTETTNLAFTYGGDSPWFIQPFVSRDGIAYQSGAISNNQKSWMEITVTGPGAIRFWWKVSSQEHLNPLTFSIDGTSQTSISGDVDWQNKAYAISSGDHMLRWTYSTGPYVYGSNAGWVDQITYEQGSNLDVTPPATAATPAAGMYASSQSVTLACNDGSGSGCARTFYCLGIGCTPTTTYSSAIAITSAKTLRYYSIDSVGNSESVMTTTYTFDNTAPSTQASPVPGTYSGVRDVSLYCNDNGMGCATTYYCLGTGCTPTTPYSSAIPITTSTDLRYYSVDRGGNTEAVQTSAFTITPDVAAPTTTPNYAGGTYSPIYLYLSCYDGVGSGCAATYYCLGAGCTPTILYSGSFKLSTSTDVRLYSVDRSGNSEAVTTVSYIIDANPPATTPSLGGGVYETPQNVTLSCSDGTGSGCSATYYCLGTGCSPSTRYSGPITISASTYLTFYSRDNVQNYEEAKSIRFNIVTGPPVTINVPTDVASIQGAIDAAKDGDTVLVAPGTYTENINFKGKAITVLSSNGADDTIIDGNQQGSVVVISSNEWFTSVLSGFTIRNGTGAAADSRFGGGVYIYGASPTLSNNKIIRNQGCRGAGIYALGSPIIRNNIITNNSVSNCGGISGGGGISLSSNFAQVIDNEISYNNSEAVGGGIYMDGSPGNLISGNRIHDNHGSNGGGIYFLNTDFQNNGYSVQIIQNVIYKNNAYNGGGIYCSRGGGLLVNNTIAENDAINGSGIYYDSYYWGPGFIINNVVSGKAEQSLVYSDLSSALNPPLKNNIFFSPTNNVYGGTYSDQNGINVNITTDPLLAGAVFGYYGLLPGSLAIDAGDNSVSALPATDMNGSPRLIDGTGQGIARVDIGAYEYDPDEPRAVVTGAPAGATQTTSATISVSGADIVSYRYAVDGGPFTTDDTPLSTPIELSGLIGGTHAVAVVGKSSTREQHVSSATVAAWTIDDVSPTTTAAPATGTYAEPQSVTLTCNDGSGSGCAATYYCLGIGCTPATPYNSPIAIAAPTALRFYSQDQFGYQEEIKTIFYAFTGSISGRVTDSVSGTGIQGMPVDVYNSFTGWWVKVGYTDADGAYTVFGLPTGSYKLRFFDYFNNIYLSQWYNNKADMNSANSIVVVPPGTTSGIDVVLVQGGVISGHITGSDSGAGVPNASVILYNAASGAQISSTYSNASGNYSIGGLRSGTFKVRVSAPPNSGYFGVWYGNKPDLASADSVTVTAPGTATDINVALPKGGVISGRVTGSDSGAGLQDVYVMLYDSSKGLWIGSGYTNATGFYTFNGLASGSCKLYFSPPSGYLSQWYSNKGDIATADSVVVTSPGTTGGIDVALAKGGSISGRVTASDTGAALQNVYISLLEATSGTYVRSAFTDISGKYSINGLQSGSFKLNFNISSNSGYLSQWYSNKVGLATANSVAVTAPGTTGGIDVALSKGGDMRGRVVGSDNGSAIQSVSVTIFEASNDAYIHSTYTDSSGEYSITGLSPGSYKVNFSAPPSSGYFGQWYNNKPDMSSATTVTISAGETTDGIDAALDIGGGISGKVIDSKTGTGIAYVNVDFYDVASGDRIDYAVTNSNGTYSIRGLTTGQYRLRFGAYYNGYLSQWYDKKSGPVCADLVTVTAPSTTSGIDVALVKGGSITGMVTDSVTFMGIPGASVIVSDKSNLASIFWGATDLSGSYTVTGLPDGDYSVVFRAPGYIKQSYGQSANTGQNQVKVTSQQVTTGIDAMLVPGGRITGRVIDGATGEGVDGVLVNLLNSATNEWLDGTYSEMSGDYVLTGVPTGIYVVEFNGINAGYLTSWYDGQADRQNATPVTVSAPEPTFGIDITLTREARAGGSISGRVTDMDTGEGIADVTVSLFDPVSGIKLAYRAATGRDGTYIINGLSEGNYLVNFGDSAYSNNGYISRWYVDAKDMTQATSVAVAAAAGRTGIDCALSKGGSISGAIMVDSCPGPGTVWVTAYDATTGKEAGHAWVNTGIGTGFIIAGLPTGSYKLLIESLDGNYIRQWYNDKHDMASADLVAVSAPDATNGIGFFLSSGASAINGRVTDENGIPVGNLSVRAYDTYSNGMVGETTTSPGGDYSLGGLAEGIYKLLFAGNSFYAGKWYKTVGDTSPFTPVSVSAAASVTGIDAVLSMAPDGDLNGSGGFTDIGDALLALRMAVGLVAPNNDNYLHGDVAPAMNGVSVPDGIIDIRDALLMLKKAVGLPW